MDPIPKWFVPLCQTPTTILDRLKSFFVKHQDSKYLDDLVFLFGTFNVDRVQSLLPEKMKKRYVERIEKQETRFQLIWKYCLLSIQKQKPLNQQIVDQLFEHSTFSGKNPQELIIEELASYFLTRKMPLQECKALNCYKIERVKRRIDGISDALNKVIDVLFHVELYPERFSNLSLAEKCLLFRNTALMTPKRAISWGELFHEWIKNSESKLQISSLIFDQICIPIQDGAMRIKQQAQSLNFKQFVSASTLYYLMETDKSPLPYVPVIRKNLEVAWKCVDSDKERQHAMYFIETLSLWYHNAQVEFPFTSALQVLNSLFEGHQKGVVYHVLHAALHYFYALGKLNVEIDKKSGCREFLFESIYAVTPERLRGFDQEIEGETISRGPFVLDEEFIQFTQDYSLSKEKWGEIILRFSRTRFKSIFGAEIACVGLKKHLQLVKKMETILGASLPKNTLEDFLFFQAAKKGASAVLDQFEQLRKKIYDGYLDALSLPDDLYQEWLHLPSQLVEQFIPLKLKFVGNINGYRDRNDTFPSLLFGLGRILQMAIYPKPLVSFEKFIPRIIWETDKGELCELILKEEGQKAVDSLQLFEPHFPSGPCWRASWNLKRSCFTISILNSTHLLQTATFSLKLPSSASVDLKLFRKLVDGLGKEGLSDEEALIVPLEQQKFSSSLPRSITSSHQQFDWHLNNSPLVSSYLHSRPQKDLKQETKKELFEFVRSLHSLFRKAFYAVLLNNRTFNPLDSEILHLIPFENGFYLRPQVTNCVSEIDVVRISDYRHHLNMLYEEWMLDAEETFFKENLFRLKIGTETFRELSVSIKIEGQKHPDTFIPITWILEGHECELTIKYSPFESQDDFVRTMAWQLALLKQEFLRRD